MLTTSEPTPTPNKYEEILANHEEPEIYATDTIKLVLKLTVPFIILVHVVIL